MLAMHIPDGFVDGPTSLLAAILAFGGVAACLRKTSATLDEREIPVVGLAAAFVFAAQMLNFPVANGTSGHFFGGVLAAVLVGPYAGALAVTVVLAVQALLFADGGLSALGLNVVNMALIGAFAGYGIFLVLRRLLGNTTAVVSPAAGFAAFVAPLLAAAAFVLEHAIGGNDAVSVGSVAGAMIGVHALIGIGEAVITGLAVGAVIATRPDLVYGARRARASAVSVVPVTAGARPLPMRAFGGVGIAACFVMVLFIAPWADTNPDGLEKVSADKAIDAGAVEHDLAGSPLADYGVEGVDSPVLATGLAGGIGVATLAIGTTMLWAIRRRSTG